MRRQHGFTLIELLMVVLIIGMLAAIAIPVYNGTRASAHDSASISALRLAAEIATQDHATNDTFPAAATLQSDIQTGQPTIGSVTTTIYEDGLTLGHVSVIGVPTTNSVMLAAESTSGHLCQVSLNNGALAGPACVTSAVPTTNSWGSLKTTFPNTPGLITVGTDGNMWMTNGTYSVLVISPVTRAVIRTYTISGGSSYPYAIAFDSTGNAWVTEPASDQVAKLNVATGAVTQYSVASGANPGDIVRGADGSMWMVAGSAANNGNADVVKLNPTTGTQTTYGTAYSDVVGVTAAADGSIWYCGSNGGGDRAVHMSATGVTLTSVAFGGASGQCDPSAFTSDANGNIWLIDAGTNALAEVNTTTNTSQEWTIPTTVAGNAASVTTSPDGKYVWCDDGTNLDAFSTTANTFAAYSTPTGTSTSSWPLTLGQDDNVWAIIKSGSFGSVLTLETFTP